MKGLSKNRTNNSICFQCGKSVEECNLKSYYLKNSNIKVLSCPKYVKKKLLKVS